MNWDEHADLDDRTYLASIIRNVIMTIWGKLFVQETKLNDECGIDPIDPNPYHGMQNEHGHQLLEVSREIPPEVADLV